MSRFRSFWLAACAALSIMGVGATPLAIGQTHRLTDLGPLSGTQSLASDISSSGQVVGASRNASGVVRSTLWSGGSVVDLGALGGASSIASHINSTGQVAGWSYDAVSSSSRATLWDGGSIIDLGALGGAGLSWAYGINDAGQIVGVTLHGGGQAATLWDGGSIIDLGTLGGTSGVAYGINNAGQAAGWSTTFLESGRATLWDGGSVIDLGTLGGMGIHSVAHAINDAGQVVGYSDTGESTLIYHATLWDGGSIIDLGTLGGRGSVAYDINNSGQVVGQSDTGGAIHAALWESGSIVDLNTVLDASGAGWTLKTARAINDAGQIVGIGTVGPAARRAFLLTPLHPGLKLDISVNKTVLSRSGDTLTLTGTTTPGSSPINADVYIALDRPGGTRLYLQRDGSLTTTPTPYAANWPVSSMTGPIYAHTFAGTELLGDYKWSGVLTTPGTGKFMTVMDTAPFTVVP